MFSATVVGRVTKEPRVFGKVLKFTIVHNPGKNAKGQSVFFDVTIKADGYNSATAKKLVKGDTITAVGRCEKVTWTKGEGYSFELPFPELHIPYEIFERPDPEAPVEAKRNGKNVPLSVPNDLDGLDFGDGVTDDDIPF